MGQSKGQDLRLWASDIEQFWVRRAKDFELGVKNYTPRLIAAANITADSRVLDIGCGTGELARLIAPVAESVTAIDISEMIIQLARTIDSDQNISYIIGDAQDYPFSSGFFNRVISRNGVMFFRDPYAAWGNIYRALSPLALVTMQVWDIPAANPWHSVMDTLLSPSPEAKKSGNDFPAPFSMSDSATVIAMLAQVGFSDITAASVTVPFIYGITLEEAHDFLLDQYRSLRKKDNIYDDEVFSQALRAELAQHYTDDRGVAYDSAALVYQCIKPGSA